MIFFVLVLACEPESVTVRIVCCCPHSCRMCTNAVPNNISLVGGQLINAVTRTSNLAVDDFSECTGVASGGLDAMAYDVCGNNEYICWY